MLDLLKDISIKTLGFLVPWIVRLFYKPEKITEKIKIRIRSDGDGIIYNCADIANVRIWLLITNLSPFPVELDRMIGQLTCGCVIGELIFLRKCQVPAAQEREVLIESYLSESQAQHVRRNNGKQDARIYLSAYFNCNIHKLIIERETLTNNIRYVNCQQLQTL